ncbi:Crp/Fnr family transcriptional regulator [Ensifer sp. NBAIM29]|nr:Crp/Fnr family transcriptional regulator [Ensifer sp. NBAIM29]
MIRFVRLLPLAESEKQAILNTPREIRRFQRGDTIYRPEEPADVARILVEGLAVQYRILRNGERQSADLVFPTRFCDLGCILFGESNHFLAALTDIEIVEISACRVLDLFARYPQIPILLLHQETRDRSILFERLLSVGRRPAIRRLAHLLTEFRLRRELAGVSPSRARRILLPQRWIGDFLGLTTEHVSRTIGKLKAMGLIEQHRNGLVIRDPVGLARLAEFDPGYLHPGADAPPQPASARRGREDGPTVMRLEDRASDREGSKRAANKG